MYVSQSHACNHTRYTRRMTLAEQLMFLISVRDIEITCMMMMLRDSSGAASENGDVS